MKTKFKGKNIQMEYSGTLAGGKALFLYLDGNSYGVVDDKEKSLTKLYSELGSAMCFIRNLVRQLHSTPDGGNG